jgi:ribosomal-protein-alanine N-acetyltransferase
MSLNKFFSIRPLEPADAVAISAFMRLQSPEYLHFFYAFGSDEAATAEMLSASVLDVYSGVFWQENLIGVFFLRGWDAGYEIPSFGVLIDEKHRGRAFLNLTVDAAKLICRLSGVNRYMVKIHPNNTALKNVHRMGFYQTGVEESTGNVIFHLDF